MSKASQQREKERAARKRRHGFATWEELRNWQDRERAVWFADHHSFSEDKHEYIPYEDFPLKSPPSEWEDVIDIHQCLKINEN